MPNGLKSNFTSKPNDQDSVVFTNGEGNFEKGGSTVAITVGVVIATATLILCVLFSYKAAIRRKKVTELSEEIARMESIRQAVQLKLKELQHVEDSVSDLDEKDMMESKPHKVTFGDVTEISPLNSPIESPVIQHGSIRKEFRGGKYEYSPRIHRHKRRQPECRHSFSERSFNHVSYPQDREQLSFRQHHHNQERKVNKNHNYENISTNRSNIHINHRQKLGLHSNNHKEEESEANDPSQMYQNVATANLQTHKADTPRISNSNRIDTQSNGLSSHSRRKIPTGGIFIEI